jgi:hypothetical protein
MVTEEQKTAWQWMLVRKLVEMMFVVQTIERVSGKGWPTHWDDSDILASVVASLIGLDVVAEIVAKGRDRFSGPGEGTSGKP